MKIEQRFDVFEVVSARARGEMALMRQVLEVGR
jgi:hypothetical protein